MAPSPGYVYRSRELAEAFALPRAPTPEQPRSGGRRFVFVQDKGSLLAPDCVRARPGEGGQHDDAVDVLVAAGDDEWQYGGPATWDITRGGWACREVDFETWSRFGTGRGVSRELPEGARREAAAIIDAVMIQVGPMGRIPVVRGQCRVLEQTRGGGLRVDGGATGFRPRIVSATDVGWVAETARQRQQSYSSTTVHDVNEVRYLRGTPRQKTRWVDTELAIAIARVAEAAASRSRTR